MKPGNQRAFKKEARMRVKFRNYERQATIFGPQTWSTCHSPKYRLCRRHIVRHLQPLTSTLQRRRNYGPYSTEREEQPAAHRVRLQGIHETLIPDFASTTLVMLMSSNG